MGAEFDASWSLDSSAHATARAFCCLNARAVDYARFWLVFLDGGRFNGHQVVPAAWVAQSTAAQGLAGFDDTARRNIERPASPNPAFYAWQWRRPAADAAAGVILVDRVPGPDFYAQGLHGQILYIAPESSSVVLRLGSRWGEVNWPVWMRQFARDNPQATRGQ